MRKRDKAGRVLVLPNQIPNLIEKYHLSRTQVDGAVWTIAPDGTRRSAAAAVNRVFQALGGGWGWVATLYQLAPIHWIEDRAYCWIADHRSWLSRWIGAPPEWKS